jgi:hypothetical protein
MEGRTFRSGRTRTFPSAIVILIAAVLGAPYSFHARQSDAPSDQQASRVTLRATGGLPAHIVGTFRDPVAFAAATTGEYLVLDRRAHTVYLIDRSGERVQKTLQIGLETGKILGPAALSLASNDIFAVADAPKQFERIQYFTLSGETLGAFYLQTRAAPQLTFRMLTTRAASMSFTGKTFLMNQPESGALISEIDTNGAVIRQIGNLRPTGHEADRSAHLALNAGWPLPDPTGGFIFVFQTGVPMFRKYSASGQLIFERHIEGVELDTAIQQLPTTWSARSSEAGTIPVVPPMVRAATVDPLGRLWVSLFQPFTYVYSPAGDKVKTVQFSGASLLEVTSLFFANQHRLLVTPGCYEFRIEF